MASSQLHSPKAVWFLGAPLSKAIAMSTASVYVLAEMNHWHDALILGECGDSSSYLSVPLISETMEYNFSLSWFISLTILSVLDNTPPLHPPKCHSPIQDTSKIFDHAQFYRIFVCNITFASMGELIFGLLALCPLMRRFEREVRRNTRCQAFSIYS